MNLIKNILALTREELLLVDLEGLTPLLEKKEALIAEIGTVDQALAQAGDAGLEAITAQPQQDFADLVAAVLENEQAMEERINREFSRLKKELREFDRQTTLRRYLQGRGTGAGNLNLKK